MRARCGSWVLTTYDSRVAADMKKNMLHWQHTYRLLQCRDLSLACGRSFTCSSSSTCAHKTVLLSVAKGQFRIGHLNGKYFGFLQYSLPVNSAAPGKPFIRIIGVVGHLGGGRLTSPSCHETGECLSGDQHAASRMGVAYPLVHFRRGAGDTEGRKEVQAVGP